MGVVTVTLMTGFTLSATVVSAQASITASAATQTTQISEASLVSTDSSVKSATPTGSAQVPGNESASSSGSSSATSSSTSQSSDSESSVTSAASVDSASQTNPKTLANQQLTQPAMDVNGNLLKLDTTDKQGAFDQSATAKATAGQTTPTNATNIANVVKDQQGNYWIPVTDNQADKTTGVNTYTQLTDYTFTKNNDSSSYAVTG